MNKKESWFNPNFLNKIKNNKIIKKINSNIDKHSRVFFTIEQKINQEKIIEYKLDSALETLTDLDVIEKKHKNKTKNDIKKARRKKLLNTLMFLLNIALVVLVFYNFANEQGGIQPLSTLFENHPNWGLLFVAFAIFLITTIFNALKFFFLIHNKTKKWRPWFSYKLAVYGRYYDHITPMGSGGQPFEIYYLKKEGYSGDVATAIPLAKYMVWQIVTVFLCTFILIAYSGTYASSPLVLILAWIGLAAVLLLFLFVLFMSITKKWGASLVVGILKLLHKCKIIKNYRKTLENVLHFVKSYQLCIKQIIKSPGTLIGTTLATLGSTLCNASVAYFVLRAFTNTPAMSLWEIICACHVCDLAVAIIPLPGGSGATELSFDALLGSLFPIGTLFWGVLIWRILTYYIYIIQGWILFGWDIIEKKIKTKKNLQIVPPKHKFK